MTAAAATSTVRNGQGWAMEITHNHIILTVDGNDEDAMDRAITDLATWTDPAMWVGEWTDCTDDGVETWVYDWEPAAA